MKKMFLFILSAIFIIGCSTTSTRPTPEKIQEINGYLLEQTKQKPLQGPVTKEQYEQGYNYLSEVPKNK